MGRLIYASNASLDGFTEDAAGRFDWAPPDDDVFDAITEVMRSARTYLYGRRMYETMAPWETDASLAEASPRTQTFATVWQGARKVVCSTTLPAALTTRTTVVRSFDPDAVAAMKAESPDDVLVGGPHLAREALDAGLVDECELFVWPVILGGRNPALPGDRRRDFELVDERRVGDGVVHLRLRPR